MEEIQEFVIELTYTAQALLKHPGLVKLDFSDYLVNTVPAIGDGVSFVVDGANADLVVLKRRFIYEPGRTTALLRLDLGD
ncbi:hypothetical protein [Burkholderia ubonensis]|uniref:hypothetical protein n=1 Tax=Burkholderia ubonensis TaxID=101571 RepID=UPI00075370B2|nr:hypothetical protein [Burkholderia ubonensis]KWK74120.1 hypothetical protein WM15_32200 [Burkholderia ubonensis]